MYSHNTSHHHTKSKPEVHTWTRWGQIQSKSLEFGRSRAKSGRPWSTPGGILATFWACSGELGATRRCSDQSGADFARSWVEFGPESIDLDSGRSSTYHKIGLKSSIHLWADLGRLVPKSTMARHRASLGDPGRQNEYYIRAVIEQWSAVLTTAIY